MCILIRMLLVSVPILGLISCSPDSKSRALRAATSKPYQPPPPKIVNGEGVVVPESWGALNQMTLDLRDRLDFTESKADRMEVITRCDGSDFVRTSRPDPKTPVLAADLLPDELLARRLAETPTLCNFDIQVFDKSNSRLVFTAVDVRVSDQSRPAVFWGRDGESIHSSLLRVGELRGVRVRYDGSGDARLICRDVHFTRLPFNQVLEFDSFDLANPTSRDHRPEPVVRHFPNQICRVVIEKDEHIVAWTEIRDLRFPLAPVTISSLNIAPKSVQVTSEAPLAGAFEVGVVSISNPEPTARHLRLREGAYPVLVRIYSERRGIKGKSTWSGNNWIRTQARADEVSSENGVTRLTVGAGASATLIFHLDPKLRLRCEDRLTAVILSTPSVAMDEVDESGRVLFSYSVGTGSGALLRNSYLNSGDKLDEYTIEYSNPLCYP